MKKPVVHYEAERWPTKQIDTACRAFYGLESLPKTSNKPDVTCRNCRRTKIYKGKYA